MLGLWLGLFLKVEKKKRLMWMLAGVCWALGIGISSAFSVVGFQHVKQPRMIFRAQGE